MLAKTYSASVSGIQGQVITVEAAAQRALPQIHLTGLPGEVVRESRERIRACLQALGFEVPSTRIVVHLSPAMARKQGSELDLAIALSVLQAENLLAASDLRHTAFLGELSLDGRLHSVERSLCLLKALESHEGIDTVIVPRSLEREALLLGTKKTRLASQIGEVIDHLLGRSKLSPPAPSESGFFWDTAAEGPRDFPKWAGHAIGRRALEIAIAGRHHLLLTGPPGAGKTLLAQAAPSLLPPLERTEWLDWALATGADLSPEHLPLAKQRPFRAPHHSISAAGLLGGGSQKVYAGEVTLAHSGVLFLDEFPEFRKDALEGLREPMQEGRIRLHRIGQDIELPARFTLIAAMNPCPCGFSGTHIACRCPPDKRRKYQAKASGPLLDRMGIRVGLSSLETEPDAEANLEIAPMRPAPSFESLYPRIVAAIRAQRRRYPHPGTRNGDADTDLGKEDFRLPASAQAWFETITRQNRYSFRTQHKWLRIARTIADLEADIEASTAPPLQSAHLIEAKAFLCAPS